jgi:glutathione S-transferase
MPLVLHFHPLASFCWKALIALYENGTDFDRVVVNLGDPESAEAFRTLWPMMKMPVLEDRSRGAVVAESTIVIEYLDSFHPGPTRLIPADPDDAWKVRFLDRFFDHYLHEPMQKIVIDALRPAGNADAFGVGQAREQIRQSYAFLEDELAQRRFFRDAAFTLADCAAAPALFYANVVEPIDPAHRRTGSYLAGLMERPSFARVLDEAEPFFHMVPVDPKPKRRLSN